MHALVEGLTAPMLIRSLLLALAVSLLSIPAIAQTPEATPDAGAAVDDHVAWVLSLFDGAADDLTAGEVEARFDETFLELVPPEEVIATVRQLAAELGPLELVEEQPAGNNEYIGVYRAASGDGVMISLAVDPATGLIAGFFITPAPLPDQEGTLAASPEATPVASPVARVPVVNDPEAQIAAHAEKVAAIRAIGEPVRDAVLAGDDAALEPYLAPEVASLLTDTPVQELLGAYTRRQVQFALPEVNAVFFGQWNGEEISGVMVQNGVPYAFTLTTDTAQRGDLPRGHWSGTLTEIGLGVEIDFETGERGELRATISIPMQGLVDAPLSDVAYMPERPIGDMVDERVFAPGGANDGYTADYAWGDHLLRVTVAVDVESELVSGLQIIPAVPTRAPATVPESNTVWRLPFDGTWWVFWGGDDALRNYHVIAPPQRYAYDLVIWKDGATFAGDGAENEDYWVWGQEVRAPADGEVVVAVNDEVDLPPNAPLEQRSRSRTPGGNYVVLQTGENELVFLAHMQQGSVQVDAGDRVRAGDVLGLVGNSGNSSEPHLHLHAQDTPEILDFQANGIPIRFDRILVDGESVDDALPVQGSFIAPD